MPNPAPICMHIKTNGIRCGSPAVSGTDFCHHHSALKTALTSPPNSKPGRGGFAPIPFVFPEDRASMQINFFLLLQAYNEQRIDQRTYNSFLSLLRSMARNLGKTGSLVEEPRDQGSGNRKKSDERSAFSDQKSRAQEDDDEGGDDPFADLRHLPQSEFYAAVRQRGPQMFEEELTAEEEQKKAVANFAR